MEESTVIKYLSCALIAGYIYVMFFSRAEQETEPRKDLITFIWVVVILCFIVIPFLGGAWDR